ncbi:MAG: flagellar motor switch protein FliM [Verrucomicrobia bacterium]|nr:flagellar motor switch protein FliM [Verrucomicrobiota bacterium]
MPEDTPNPQSQTGAFSKAEVEQLLAQLGATGPPATASALAPPSSGGVPLGSETIQKFDFRHPAFLSSTELRRLRTKHDEFARSLGGRLSIYLRMEFSLVVNRLQTLTFREFTEKLPAATMLTLFKAEPLRGIGVLDVHPRLALTLVDRLMGGPAKAPDLDRELSELEQTLFDQAAVVILDEWCVQWAAVQKLSPSILGHENSGRYLQTSAAETPMVIVSIEARLNDCIEQMQLALPLPTVEPMVKKLTVVPDTAAPETPAPAPGELRWNPALDAVPLPVTATWNNMERTVRELLALKPGDMLPLDSDLVNQVQVRLGGLHKFNGRLGSFGKQRAVELTEVLPPQKP